VTRILGGHADNSVPETCDILFDRRMIPGEDEAGVQKEFEQMIAEAKQVHGVDAQILEFRPTTGGATETAADLPIVQAARAAAARHGVADTNPHGLSGACDLVHFRSIGAQGVVIGPGSVAMAHKPDEYVPEDEFLTSSLIYRDTALGIFPQRGA
jgi:acetylornithine deacetylase/succinyl-diaminopimelate desuccinylase